MKQSLLSFLETFPGATAAFLGYTNVASNFKTRSIDGIVKYTLPFKKLLWELLYEYFNHLLDKILEGICYASP